MEYLLKLTQADVVLLGLALDERPHKEVADVMVRIQKQVLEQEKAYVETRQANVKKEIEARAQALAEEQTQAKGSRRRKKQPSEGV
jgi:hypothetical protein